MQIRTLMIHCWQRHTLLILSLLLFVGVGLLYLPSIHVPFYLDDAPSIHQNTHLINGNFEGFRRNYWRRLAGYMTFWWEFPLWGLEPRGYHYLNILLHASNALLIFHCLRLLLTHYRPQHTTQMLALAFSCALIWAVHPLNSQAVVYIIQRLTLLAAFWALLSLLFWIIARQNTTPRRWLYFGLALICWPIGVFSKEYVLLLPLLWLALDILFFGKGSRHFFVSSLAAISAMAVGAAIAHALLGWDLAYLDQLTRDTSRITRTDYFLTQQSVLAFYIKQVFYPYPILLHHDIPTIIGWSEARPWLFLHGSGLLIALLLARKLPLISLSILLFYSFSFVESGVIPIRDMIFEHRMYLPSLGVILLSVTLLFTLISGVLKSRPALSVAAFVCLSTCLCVLLASLTWQRIQQWQEPERFYAHALRHSQNPTLLHNAGVMYAEAGQLARADALIARAFDSYLEHNMVVEDIFENYVRLLAKRQRHERINQLYRDYMPLFLHRPRVASHLLTVYAGLPHNYRNCRRILPILDQALELNPRNHTAQQHRQACLGTPLTP